MVFSGVVQLGSAGPGVACALVRLWGQADRYIRSWQVRAQAVTGSDGSFSLSDCLQYQDSSQPLPVFHYRIETLNPAG